MADYKLIKVNVGKIRAKIEELGLFAGKVSQDMGHDTTFLAKSLGRGSMTKADYFLLCHLLNIDYDEYLYQAVKDPEPETETVKDSEIIELLKENNRLLTEIIEMWKVPEVKNEH